MIIMIMIIIIIIIVIMVIVFNGNSNGNSNSKAGAVSHCGGAQTGSQTCRPGGRAASSLLMTFVCIIFS